MIAFNTSPDRQSDFTTRPQSQGEKAKEAVGLLLIPFGRSLSHKRSRLVSRSFRTKYSIQGPRALPHQSQPRQPDTSRRWAHSSSIRLDSYTSASTIWVRSPGTSVDEIPLLPVNSYSLYMATCVGRTSVIASHLGALASPDIFSAHHIQPSLRKERLTWIVCHASSKAVRSSGSTKGAARFGCRNSLEKKLEASMLLSIDLTYGHIHEAVRDTSIIVLRRCRRKKKQIQRESFHVSAIDSIDF